MTEYVHDYVQTPTLCILKCKMKLSTENTFVQIKTLIGKNESAAKSHWFELI
jgi:hypothetical protein